VAAAAGSASPAPAVAVAARPVAVAAATARAAAGASDVSDGAGGGGSSFVAVGALDVSSAASSRVGDGQVTISYDPIADSCTPALNVAPEFTG